MSFQLQGRGKVNILISSSQFICGRVKKGKLFQLQLIVLLGRRNVKHQFFTLWWYPNFLKISGFSWPNKSLDCVKNHVSRPWQDANDNTEKPGTRFRRRGAPNLGVRARNVIRSHVSQNHILRARQRSLTIPEKRSEAKITPWGSRMRKHLWRE